MYSPEIIYPPTSDQIQTFIENLRLLNALNMPDQADDDGAVVSVHAQPSEKSLSLCRRFTGQTPSGDFNACYFEYNVTEAGALTTYVHIDSAGNCTSIDDIGPSEEGHDQGVIPLYEKGCDMDLIPSDKDSPAIKALAADFRSLSSSELDELNQLTGRIIKNGVDVSARRYGPTAN